MASASPGWLAARTESLRFIFMSSQNCSHKWFALAVWSEKAPFKEGLWDWLAPVNGNYFYIQAKTANV